MEKNENIVEKRIKPGIIRRRARKAKPEPAPEPKVVAKAPEPTVEAPQAKAKPVPEVPKVEVEKPKPEVVAKKPDVEPVAEVKPTEVEAKPVEKPVAKTAPEAAKPEKVVVGSKDYPDGPPVGTIIQLPQNQRSNKPAPKSEKSEEGAPADPGAAAKALEDQNKSKSKKAKKSKGKNDNLEIEGFGKVSSVSQIARISTRPALDRVFQPSRTGKRRKAKRRDGKKTQVTLPKASKRIIKMEDSIVVSELAKQLGIRGGEIVKKLMDLGTMVTLNQSIDFDTASLVANDYQYETKRVGFEEAEVLKTEEDKPEQLIHRAPVVTVMGHVDHGKTSLLDAVRSTQVAEREAGGITQHIGSYQISLGPDKNLTFLDTPGHEAFTAMRARGAAVTDIVILVVAADDGVMPQTIEAINHAKAAEVPIIVAINKIDKDQANPDNIKRQLSEHGLVPEDWGGDTICALVSAKTQKGIEDLLEMVFLQAEVMELKANPNKLAKGVIVESKLDKGRGPVATVLVQEGTLNNGDMVVAGDAIGKIRAMLNDRGEPLQKAGPSTPVEILGLNEVPNASDVLQALADEKMARQVVDRRRQKARDEKMAASSKMSLEDLFTKMQSGEVQELNLVLKADVHGSLEALQSALEKISSDKVRVKILHQAVGGITESDVMLAEASQGIIIGFNVRPDTKARQVAEREGVEIKVYKVIYDVVEDVKQALEGMLAPTLEEKYIGRAEVRQVFQVSKVGAVAGCYVVDGKMVNNAKVRLLRDSVIIHEGKLNSLKRFKDDVKEVKQNYECGMGIEGYNDLKEGDVIECFEIIEKKTKLA